MKKTTIFLFPVLAGLIIFSSCNSVKNPSEFTSADMIFAEGVKLFENEDYIEAKKFFDVIKLQYPASQFADDAQYYLSETSFKREEFIIAAYNYSTLRKIYPTSNYAKESLFKTALCYYNLSPPYDRDQEYTKKAISTFLEYHLVYPNDSLKSNIEAYIVEMRNKLAHREYFTAELYRKLGSPLSSLIYYETVISDYDDTEFYEPAYLGKIETLVLVKRVDEAKALIDVYKRKFPKSVHLNELQTIENNLNPSKGN
jgi:outer membrane protein assembly factor BamD